MSDEMPLSESEKEGLKFLERDFSQCFQQKRHYDAQIFDILKFMFTGYTAIIGIALGLYQFYLKEGKDLSIPAIAILSVGLLLGLFMFSLAIRNRVYFVHVTRYINEHRNFFLKLKPMSFENETKMYTNIKQPPFFHWRSSQAWMTYIMAFLNSGLLGANIYIICASSSYRWTSVIIGFFILFAAQLITSILYLKSRENKSASMSVFGED